jgi:hypothetical protein
MNGNIILGLTNIAVALVLIGVSIPLVMNKIKMNSFYGVRIPKAFLSEENWYKINAYGGKQLIIWSIPVIISGIVSFFIPLNEENKEILPLVLGAGPIVLCLAIAVIRITIYSNKL